MKLSLSITASALAAGLAFSSMPLFAEDNSSSSYKVLASENEGFNLMRVESYMKKGDEYLLRDDFDKAIEEFLNARTMANALIAFYGDIASSFKGIDARIPREMNANSRKAFKSLAKANLRLASVYRKKKESGTGVKYLVEALRIMTPAKDEGKKAYQELIDLGFVEIPYRGGRK